MRMFAVILAVACATPAFACPTNVCDVSFADVGKDFREGWAKHCREKGLAPWVSLCADDGSRFCRERKDLWRVPDGTCESDRSLDFSSREVREHVLVRLGELAVGWDADGVEVDWVSSGLHLRPNREREDAKYLTSFMRSARTCLAAVTKRNGHCIRLGVRLPADPGLCRELGYEIDTWIRDGLMDVVFVSGRPDANGATSKWEDLLSKAPSAIRLLPSTDPAQSGIPKKGAPRDVPPLLTTFAGKPVRTVADWEGVRRGEIRERFLSQVYGRRPAEADKPALLRFESSEPDKVMMDGKAIRKRIRCTYGGRYGTTNFVFTAFIPKSEKPVPAFLLICNRNPQQNLDPERVVKSGFWPAERIVERGYAAIAFFNGDITTDYRWDFENGIFGIFQKPWERDAESWGILSAWAWGASRVMDWIETEPTLDAGHVGVVGHSRGGKTALFAGISDARFAMTCSNCSGCGGAKLNHMELPESEHIDQIWNAIGCWFCGNFGRYRCRENEMDFDQHMWAALVAPRLLAIASASEDNWAGQEGEYMMGRFASPAWELYGKRGLVGDTFPGADHPLQDGSISYHMRTGEHNLTPYDWDRYMDFADRNGWRFP